MAGFLFNQGAYQLQSAGISWTGATIKGRLVPTAQGVADIDADVMTGIGSTEASASVTLGTCVGPTLDDVEDNVKYSSANAVFTAAALAIGACNRMVIYKFITNDAASIPIACLDITAVTPNGGDVTVTCPALGWFFTQQA
jgi:hypothetical protein